MHLSTTMLSDLPTLGHLVQMELVEDERRGASRTLFFRRATVEEAAASGQSDSITVMVTDISDSGVGLLCSHEIKLGQAFVLRLPRRTSNECFRIKCVVVRCQPSGDDGKEYAIGATFEQLLGGFGSTSSAARQGKAIN